MSIKEPTRREFFVAGAAGLAVFNLSSNAAASDLSASEPNVELV